MEFKHVSFKYPGADEPVLTDIDFTARPGETTAFIGSTGSGKSTLINLIPRFYDVTEGEVTVDGVDVRHVSMHDLRDRIGVVPQKGLLFSGTIESNIKYGALDLSDEELAEVIDVAQAKEFIETKPLGVKERFLRVVQTYQVDRNSVSQLQEHLRKILKFLSLMTASQHLISRLMPHLENVLEK